MEAKVCLFLMLIILGTLTVQGAFPRNKKKNPLDVFARRPSCPTDFGRFCVALLPCPHDYIYCPNFDCPDPDFQCCCCPVGNRE